MSCAVCKHKWCWVCGLADDYNDKSFRFHKCMMFTCTIISELFGLKWYLGLPLGILIFILTPLIMMLIIGLSIHFAIYDANITFFKSYLFICGR